LKFGRRANWLETQLATF